MASPFAVVEVTDSLVLASSAWRMSDAGPLGETVSAPYRFVVDQIAAGVVPKSFTSNLLEGRTLSVQDDHVVKWSAAPIYGGGSDTTFYNLLVLPGYDTIPLCAEEGSG
ncbi:hypothetical protein EDB19DRAFT_1903218 [Suillus lakei]|nr:hypothetical protein EDB19DRAFT_1903218 [Suillus lakei]